MNSRRWLLGIGVVVLSISALLGTAAPDPIAPGRADHVRWDIISLSFPPTPPATVGPDGVAFAQADPDRKIKLTGAGEFVAPASSATSGAVTGGGTWETFGPGDVLTGSGTYQVTKLVSWEFANLQTGTVIDLIGNVNERANGTAVFRIAYSDGSQGTLGVGCHGPGAPDGIQEGVIATKGFVTYWTAQAPLPNVDANRTLFHVRR